jgi:phosphoenolpyruvate-protein kinase (PTS system EI component)
MPTPSPGDWIFCPSAPTTWSSTRWHIDRVDDEINYLYDPTHPAVLRLIREVIDGRRRHDVPISMCGEMAGDPRCVPLLLGMGLREFSMQPAALFDVREQIGELGPALLRADQVFRHRCRRPAERFEQLNPVSY